MNGYQEHALDSASAVDLVVALYDGILRFLYTAVAAVERNDAEARRTAVKRALALQIEDEMKRRHISKSTLARRMHTSRVAVRDTSLRHAAGVRVRCADRVATLHVPFASKTALNARHACPAGV